jgi:two-component system, NtrC family, response regulator AtoC
VKNNALLIVEDDPDVRDSLSTVLREEGYQVHTAEDAESGLVALIKTRYDAALIDLRLPGMTGIDFLRAARQQSPDTNCIMMTSFPTATSAVDAMKIGAVDYISKPINDHELKTLLSRTLEKKSPLAEAAAFPSLNESGESLEVKVEKDNSKKGRFCHLVGDDGRMQKIYSVIEAIKDTDITVLLKGESGTGKGMIAQAIHKTDPIRCDGPYIEVSCGAIPRELLESELFGHVKGAFTSAIRDRIGRFELANGGTILLDEIDSLPPYLQVKLLRIIQNKVFEMVGDVKTKRVDVRIIAATNRDLEEEIRKGNFREDLYYRLKVIAIDVPPLRERKNDILPLTRHFLNLLNQRLKRNIKAITKEAVEILIHYDWPGNVRELENTLEWVAVLTQGQTIQVENLPAHLVQYKQKPSSALGLRNALKGGLREPEKQLIVQALEQAGGNRKKAATILNISRTTLYNKIRQHELM